jgi:hypothetical protein
MVWYDRRLPDEPVADWSGLDGDRPVRAEQERFFVRDVRDGGDEEEAADAWLSRRQDDLLVASAAAGQSGSWSRYRDGVDGSKQECESDDACSGSHECRP